MEMESLFTYLVMAVKSRIPTCLVGDPGIGKTSIWRQVALYLGIKLMEIHPIEWETIDFRGFPVVENGVPRFVPYGEMAEILTSGEEIILLFDDLGHAKIDVLKSVMQIIRGRLGENVIPENVYVGCATNDTTDSAGVQGFPEPLKSSMVLINVEHSAQASDAHAAKENWREDLRMVLHYNPELWHAPAPTMRLEKTPCPREWERVNKHLDMFDDGINSGFISKAQLAGMEFAAYKGCVGKDAAQIVVSQIEAMRILPMPMSVLEHPLTVDIPDASDQLSVLYILCSRVASLFEDDTIKTSDNRMAMWTFVERLPRIFKRMTIQKMANADAAFKVMTQYNRYRSELNQNIDAA